MYEPQQVGYLLLCSFLATLDIKDFTGMNFCERNLYKDFTGMKFAFALWNIFSTTLGYGFENDLSKNL